MNTPDGASISGSPSFVVANEGQAWECRAHAWYPKNTPVAAITALSGVTLSGTTTLPSSTQVSSAGLLGVNVAPTLAQVQLGGTYTTSNQSILRNATTLVSTDTSNNFGFRFIGTFRPSGASLSEADGISSEPQLDSGTSINVTTLTGLYSRLRLAGYTGTLTNGYGLLVDNPSAGSNAITNFAAVRVAAITNGNGVTSGTISNYGFFPAPATAAAAAGGTVNNRTGRFDVPTGSGAGTTTNYGVYITGNGGSGGGGTTTNYALLSDSTASTSFAGVAFLLPNLATDATHTDNTVCWDTGTGQLYKGSGAAGICLGTSSLRFKNSIQPLPSMLDKVASLKPSTYRFNKGYGDDGAREMYGFIAEDVVTVLPDLVGRDVGGKPNSVDWAGLVPVLVKALQEQQAEIASIRGKLK